MEKWIWLAMGLGFAAQNSGEILAEFSSGIEEICENLRSPRLTRLLKAKQAERLYSTTPKDYLPLIEEVKARKIRIITYDNRQYPEILRQIGSPPLVLYVKGNASLLNNKLCIGMVGTRKPSRYGVDSTRFLGKALAEKGAVIVSGMAAGLDTKAHMAALEVNAPTIACIAFGHDMCYPAHNRGLMQTIEKHGAVVSEYPVGTGCEKPYFLHRNRLIAGISQAIVVTEARIRSGTMSTLNFAAEYGRDVFAVPGSIFSELSQGTNAMLLEGVAPATSADEILNTVCMRSSHAFLSFSSKKGTSSIAGGYKVNGQLEFDDALLVGEKAEKKNETLEKTLPQISANATAVFKVLQSVPQGMDEICAACGLHTGAAMSALTELEILGLLVQHAGRKFSTAQL